MDYIDSNKEAWEEAFENRSIEWDKGKLYRLTTEYCPYLEKEMVEELKKFDFTSSTIAQFCCNDGRELLSITKLGAKQAVGFDIAGKSYESKTFTSYSYTFSDLLNALLKNGIYIKKLREFDYDISGLFDILSGKGIPLSYILIGEKL
ncbi:MAG TPA: hypothetical protein VIK72_10420 [Clostridiaceae bacterium]